MAPPVPAWNGLHLLDSGASTLPSLLRLVREVAAPAGANVLIYEIDFNYRFASHPELAGKDPWDRGTVRTLAEACRAAGLRLIPHVNCLGHQSWLEPAGPLLTAHPELEEAPNGTTPENTLGSGKFYCRSWCPRHPEIHPLIFGVMDELIETFRSDAFHVGMDEVFVLASPNCPRCKGADPARVYADEVSALAGHLRARGQDVLMWADRFLDGKATGYGLWEGSENGTAPALDLVPKDIVMCDWHYEGGVKGAFPSLDIFRSKGFRVWPTVWKHLEGSRSFMRAAAARNDPGVLGTLASVWTTGGRMAQALFEPGGDEGARAAAEAAVTVLKEASAARRG